MSCGNHVLLGPRGRHREKEKVKEKARARDERAKGEGENMGVARASKACDAFFFLGSIDLPRWSINIVPFSVWNSDLLNEWLHLLITSVATAVLYLPITLRELATSLKSRNCTNGTSWKWRSHKWPMLYRSNSVPPESTPVGSIRAAYDTCRHRTYV